MNYTRNYDTASDVDGSLLYSLSIDDSNYATAVSNEGDFMDLDLSDLMDIDTTLPQQQTPEPEDPVSLRAPKDRESFDDPPVSTPMGKLTRLISSFQSTPIHNQAEDEESHESSISILSPTTLGAKLALNKPKLLMPPPTTSQNDVPSDHLVDYEYDISKYNKNLSSFSSDSDINSFINRKYDSEDPSDATEEYVFNPGNGSFDTLAPEQSTPSNKQTFFNRQNYPINNQMNGLGMSSGIDQPFHNMHNAFNRPTVQIHHHHYYYGSEPNSPNKQNTPKKEQEHQNLKYAVAQNQDLTQSSILMNQDTQVARSSEHSVQIAKNPLGHNLMDPRLHGLSNQLYHLPLPWEKTASPVERIYYMLSSYLQLIVNFIAIIYIMFNVYTIIKSIKQDINHKIFIQSKNLLVEIESCRRQYSENHCFPDPVPALERQCAYWEKCMNQNPHGVGNTSSISAETIGMIINSLIEPLGLKFFMLAFGFVVVIFGCNFTFGYLRAKTYYGWDNDGNQKATLSSDRYKTAKGKKRKW